MGSICSKNTLKPGDYLNPRGKSLTGAFLATVGEIHSSFVFGAGDLDHSPLDSPYTNCNTQSSMSSETENENMVFIYSNHKQRSQQINPSSMVPVEV